MIGMIGQYGGVVDEATAWWNRTSGQSQDAAREALEQGQQAYQTYQAGQEAGAIEAAEEAVVAVNGGGYPAAPATIPDPLTDLPRQTPAWVAPVALGLGAIVVLAIVAKVAR